MDQGGFHSGRRKIALLEAELTAPGNEIAYIVKARETFYGQVKGRVEVPYGYRRAGSRLFF